VVDSLVGPTATRIAWSTTAKVYFETGNYWNYDFSWRSPAL
jgi:hypothetical protein